MRQLIGVTGQYASVDETSRPPRISCSSRACSASAAPTPAAKPRAARGVRADRRRQAAAQELLRRDAPTPRPRGKPHRAAAAHLPRRADHGPRPPHPRADVGHDPPPRRHGSTVLLTTQYLDEADQLADRIAVIDRGMVVAEGTADELKALGRRSACSCGSPTPRDLDACARLERVLGVDASSRRRPAASPPRCATPTPSPTCSSVPRRGHPPRRAQRAEADPRRGVPHPHRPRRRGRGADASRAPRPSSKGARMSACHHAPSRPARRAQEPRRASARPSASAHHGLPRPAQDPAHARAAHRRDVAADHLHADVHVHLRRRDRRRRATTCPSSSRASWRRPSSRPRS